MIFLLQSDAFCVSLLLTSLWQNILWEHSLKCRRWQLSLSQSTGILNLCQPCTVSVFSIVFQKIKHGNLQPPKNPVCNMLFRLVDPPLTTVRNLFSMLEPQAAKKNLAISKPQIITAWHSLAILRTWPLGWWVKTWTLFEFPVSSAVSRWGPWPPKVYGVFFLKVTTDLNHRVSDRYL